MIDNVQNLFDTRRKGLDYKRLEGRATVIHQLEEDGALALKFHETDVVIFRKDHVELFNGGWFTPTTKDRINYGLSLAGLGAHRLGQTKKVWYIGGTEFFDGIKIDYSGTVLNPRPKTPEINLRHVDKELLDINDNRLAQLLEQHDPLAQKVTRKLLDKYIAKLSKAIDGGTLKLTVDGGDCWFCLTTEKGEVLGDAMKDIDHLVSHLKEGYLMLRLIINALQYKGYRYPGNFLATIKDGKVVPDIETIRQHKSTILPAVRTYFEYKLITRLASQTC